MKKGKFLIRYGVILLALFIFIPSISLGDIKIFVKVAGLEGSSEDINHLNWIDASGFSGGIDAVSAAYLGGARRAERPEFEEIGIVKGIDKATVGLYMAAASGEFFPEVVIEVWDTDPAVDVSIFTLTLHNVLVNLVEFKSVSTFQEKVEFSYSRIHWETLTDGGGWDVLYHKGL